MELTTTQKSMYQIRVEHLSLMQLIEDNEGELTPEIEQQLALTNDDFNEKALSYGLVVKHFDDETAIIEKEIDRLNEKLQAAKKRKELFKKVLSESMQQFGVEKIDTPTLKLSFRKSESVEITDESQVPYTYVEEKVVKNISKAKIKEDLKQGVLVPGATIVTKQNLQIK